MSDNVVRMNCIIAFAASSGRTTGVKRACPLGEKAPQFLSAGAPGAPYPIKFVLAKTAKVFGHVPRGCISGVAWKDGVLDWCARCAQAKHFRPYFKRECARVAPVAAGWPVTMQRRAQSPDVTNLPKCAPLPPYPEYRRTVRRSGIAAPWVSACADTRL